MVSLLPVSPCGPDTAIRIALGQCHAEKCAMKECCREVSGLCLPPCHFSFTRCPQSVPVLCSPLLLQRAVTTSIPTGCATAAAVLFVRSHPNPLRSFCNTFSASVLILLTTCAAILCAAQFVKPVLCSLPPRVLLRESPMYPLRTPLSLLPPTSAHIYAPRSDPRTGTLSYRSLPNVLD